MTDHRVARTDRQALHVPVAHQRLPGGRLGEAAVQADGLHEPGQLCRGRDVRADDAAGTQGAGRRLQTVPRGQHVEDHPVGLLARRGQRLREVADREAPRRVVAAEELGDVGTRHVGELLAPLVRRHPAVRPHRAQQGAGERAGPDAGLDDVRPREDVDHGDDLRGVLGVDHRGTARHRDHELAQEGPKDEVLPARRRRDSEALVAADQVVVLEVAAVGEEALARRQLDVVPPPLLVRQPYPLPRPQRPAVDARPGLGRDVGPGGVLRLVGHGRDPSARSSGGRRVRRRRGTPGRRRRSTARRRWCRRRRGGGTPLLAGS